MKPTTSMFDAIDIVRDDLSDLYEDVVGPDMEMI